MRKNENIIYFKWRNTETDNKFTFSRQDTDYILKQILTIIIFHESAHKLRFLHIFAGFANTIKKRKGCIYG